MKALALVLALIGVVYLLFLSLTLLSYLSRLSSLKERTRGEVSGSIKEKHLYAIRAFMAICAEASFTLILALLYPFGLLPEKKLPDSAGEGAPIIVMLHGYLHNRSAFFFCAGA